jgi:hypothetical protein
MNPMRLSLTSAPPQRNHPNSPPSQEGLQADSEPLDPVPRLSSYTLQHLRTFGPFLPLPLPRKRPDTFATVPESPALRVWLPSRRCQPQKPSEASSSSQHSWASPYRAFLLSHEPVPLSKYPSAPALPYKTLPGLVPALQRLAHKKSRAHLLLPRILSQGRTFCSLGLSDLLGFRQALTHAVSLSLTTLPSRS